MKMSSMKEIIDLNKPVFLIGYHGRISIRKQLLPIADGCSVLPSELIHCHDEETANQFHPNECQLGNPGFHWP